MKKISVIIPTHNRLDILKKTLDAYNRQTLKKDCFQVIIVDDGSTDGTFDFLKTVQKTLQYKIKFFYQKNSGPNAAREKGIEESDYPLVLITGDDMIPTETLLEEHIKYHEKYSDINYSVLGFIDWHPAIKLDSFKKYITEVSGDQFGFNFIDNLQLVPYQFFYTSNISLKKIFIEKLPYIFDKDFIYPAYDDIELGLRLTEIGLKIVYNKSAIVYHYHNITIESFSQRAYNSGKMCWIFSNKQPSDTTTKHMLIQSINNYKLHTNKHYSKSIYNCAKEINKIRSDTFKPIQIDNKNIQKEIQYYQNTIFKNFITNRFALGLFEAINQESKYKRNINLAVFPESESNSSIHSYSSMRRIFFPCSLLNILNNVNIFFPDEINKTLLNQFDAVLVQNSIFFKNNILTFLNKMKILGKKIILDMDDILWESNDAKYANFKNNKNQIKEYVDLISVPTRNLKKEVESFYNIPGIVVRDFVDIFYFFYPLYGAKKRKKLSIGIINYHNQGASIDFIVQILKKILSKYKNKIIIKFLGYIPEELKGHNDIIYISSKLDYIKYAATLRKEYFDFCIVPMIETKSNNVKSNIIWQELSITKIPAIYSDLPPYKNVKNYNTGIKVLNNENEWIDAIGLMIEDEVLRNEIKENAYKDVLSNWTLQKNFGKILANFDLKS